MIATAESGDLLLSDIVGSRPGSGEVAIRPERDKYITLDQPLSHYLESKSDW
jgi:hypothetical protein